MLFINERSLSVMKTKHGLTSVDALDELAAGYNKWQEDRRLPRLVKLEKHHWAEAPVEKIGGQRVTKSICSLKQLKQHKQKGEAGRRAYFVP